MPKISRNLAHSSRTRRIVFRTAIAAGVLVAIGGAVAGTFVAQSAAAEDLERRIATQQLNETSGFRSEQLDAYAAIRDQRIAYDETLKAEAAARAAYLTTPAGAQETARNLAAEQYGWGDDQFSCLVSLWNRESGWNVNALNESSGAAGIPQALPGEKMAIAGADWQTNPATQISWGLSYISSSYGTPCAAWGHSESYNWY